jgi:hypothetical protein
VRPLQRIGVRADQLHPQDAGAEQDDRQERSCPRGWSRFTG